MKNVYLIVATDFITIKESIDKIARENKFSEEEKIKYDALNTPLDRVVEELDTFSFLVNKKLLILDNAYFLSPTKVKGYSVDNTESLEKYLNNPNPDNVLIIITDKLDERKKIVKLLKEKATIIDKEISIFDILKSDKEDYKVEDYTLRYLIDYCGNDNEKIMNEFTKLKLYKMEEKEITKDDIEKIVIKSLEDNIFSLIDAITSRNDKKALKIYSDLIENREDANKILSMVMEQFRIIYKGKVLLKENHNYNQVAQSLGIHPYRFSKAMEKAGNYSLHEIVAILNALADIDINTKTGKSNIASFETFLMSL